jgi:hypothetical protein
MDPQPSSCSASSTRNGCSKSPLKPDELIRYLILNNMLFNPADEHDQDKRQIILKGKIPRKSEKY